MVVDPHCAREMHGVLLDRLTRRELWKWMSLEPVEKSPLLDPCALYPFDAAERKRLEEMEGQKEAGEAAGKAEAKKKKKKRHSVV